MIPTFRVGATSALYIILVVFVMFGAAHLAAATYPESKFAKILIGLGF